MTEIHPVDQRLSELSVPADVIQKIKDDLGATTVEDLAGLTEADLISAGMKPLPARSLAGKLKPLAPPPARPETAVAVSFDALPAVPSEESWLAALRAGGILKVDVSTVIAAVRAALAYRAGLYVVPDALAKLMERFADESEEPVSEEFYKLRKILTRRNYGDIFEAIDGLDSSFVTESRKKQLFERVDSHLWPALVGFNEALGGWQTAWVQGAANPAMLTQAIMAASSGGAMMMPPGMMQPPDTGMLRDAADEFNNSCNRVFSGTGAQIASALAFEAKRIGEILANPRLPAMTGAANRDQLLKQLGVAVSATYPRLETNVTRFALAIAKAKDVPAGNEELQYFGSLYMLGAQIPWDQLTKGNGLGIGEGPHRGPARDGVARR